MSNVESPHLTVKQLAERYQTDAKGIYNLRHRRKLPAAITRGGRLMWPLAVIEAHERALREQDPKRPDAPEMRAPEAAAA